NERLPDRLRGCRVPEPRLAATPVGNGPRQHDELAVGAEGIGVKVSAVGQRGALSRPAGYLPQPSAAVESGGEKDRALGAEGDAVHRVLVPQRGTDLFASGAVPEARRLVPGTGRDGLAVGAEGQADDLARVSQRAQPSARAGFVEPCFPTPMVGTAPRHD